VKVPSVEPPRREDQSAGARDGTLREWLLEQGPAPPAALVEHPDIGGPAAGEPMAPPGDRFEAILAEAERALQDACAGRGERRGAYRLLAADAYLTWACELALEEDDPAPRLRDIVARVTRAAGVR
jgi:hypothetical protein